MGIAMSEDPYEVKRSLGGSIPGQSPAGLRNISMNDASISTPPMEKPPIYVTNEGIASTDPNVGTYNRAAMKAASTAGQAEAAAAPGAAAAAEAPTGLAGRTMAAGRAALGKLGGVGETISSAAGGLRTLGSGLLRAAGPAIAAKTAVDVATTPTEETDARLKSLGLDTSTQVGDSLDSGSPVERSLKAQLRYGAIPILGPAMAELAQFDPHLAGDVETRAKQVAMSGLGVNGIIDKRVPNKSGLTTAGAAAAEPKASDIPDLSGPRSPGYFPSGGGNGNGPGLGETLHGGRDANGLTADDRAAMQAAGVTFGPDGSIHGRFGAISAGTPQAGGQPGVQGDGSPLEAASANLDKEIGKVGSNVYKGVRGGNFFGEAGGAFTQNIAAELNQRAKVKSLQEKYGTDATIANNQANLAMRRAELGQTIANRNQDELKGMFDRMATVPTLDKDGNQTGTTIDPALRSRAEDFARSAVAGWDHLSPEQRAQGFENVRHKFLLQELANSGQQNTLGKFMSWTGLQDQLGGYTAQPLKVKSVRPLGIGDLGQQNAALTSVVSRRPYVEFENGKLYPLQQVVNTPELKSAFESRLKQSGKLAQAQYKKYVGGN